MYWSVAHHPSSPESHAGRPSRIRRPYTARGSCTRIANTTPHPSPSKPSENTSVPRPDTMSSDIELIRIKRWNYSCRRTASTHTKISSDDVEHIIRTRSRSLPNLPCYVNEHSARERSITKTLTYTKHSGSTPQLFDFGYDPLLHHSIY